MRMTAPSGAETAPIRLEFWHGGALAEVGAALARDPAPVLTAFSPFRLSARVDDNRAAVQRTYRRLLAEIGPTGVVTPAAEWLLDNHHIVDETFRHLRRDLSDKVFRDLPALVLASGAPVPRTLALTWTYVAVTNSDLTLAGLTEITEGFQTVSDLTIGELWAVPALLRLVLLENLRRLADRIDSSRNARSRANALADALTGADAVTARQRLAAHAADRRDESFASQLLYRLRESDDQGVEALRWLEQGLAEAGLTGDRIIAAEQNRQSSGNVTVGNIIRSLRVIDDTDWLEWFESLSRVDAILRHDPGYPQLDKPTRNAYRTVIERIARRSDCTEAEVAGRVAAGGDPGLALMGAGRGALERACRYRPTWRERALTAYRRLGWAGIAGPALLATLLIACGLVALAGHIPGPMAVALILLALLPASDAAMGLIGFVSARLIPPAQLPAYDYRGGIPETARTLVVIPCMLSSRDEIDDLLRNLELHYLANPSGAVSFALLSDWLDNPRETRPDDDALLAHARAGIEALAARYAHDGGRRFFLLHRRRLYNPGEGVWMGWERKRGKLVELNSLLRGDGETSFLDTGPRPEAGFRYVLTLDSDTRLTRGAIAALVGKLAHPVNHAVVDPVTGRVTAGYGILQPRVTPSLTTGAEASIFQRIFSTNRGLDPYVFTVSDLYQDLLAEGTFTGKGLYDIDAFRAATEGVIAENTVLSHDLLEGSLARAALVTDVQFVEDFPVQYHVDAARQHRWVRGDWQLLPFIFARAAAPGGLGRFKMIDNLRRSLVPPAWVLASVAGWLLLDTRGALLWQMALVLALIAAPMLAFLTGLAPRDPSVRMASHIRVLAHELGALAALALLKIVFAAHQAVVTGDAVLRSLYRMTVSHRNLLEWRTAGQVAAGGTGTLRHYLRGMAASPVMGGATLALTGAVNPAGLPAALPVALLWILAPLVGWAISRSDETADRLNISAADTAVLRRTARLTWWFFEDFVTPASHHLPPDNFQDNPAPKIAERTSPTNIGLYLLSVVSAREFGWISLRHACDRIDATLSTVERLPKHRGHLYNWYDTATLAVLPPQYISSVDSGNLAAHLVTLSGSLKDWAEGAEVHLPPDARGIGDVLDVLRHQLAAIPDDRRSLRPLHRRVEERIAGFAETYATYLAEPQLAPVRGINLSVIARDIRKLAQALNAELDSTAARDLVRWAGSLLATCEAVIEDTSGDRGAAAALQDRLRALAERARALAFAMDFAFLMDPDKRLLTVGWRVDTGKADPSCYDLLASESRLASFFAIAKGDLPNEHWFRLGRPVTMVGTSGVLLSWSGSMFEYLMPLLVMKERSGSALYQSDLAAIRCQIGQAHATGGVWGVSESAMNARDSAMNYQYYAFGVPALALRRSGSDDRVVAPYATMLASQIRPRQAVANLARLDALGALGPHGYFDAIDMTRDRLPDGAGHVVVRTVMAHHQGMAITAIANAVMDGIHRDRFHADPVVQAAELLLQEKAPREIVPVTPSVHAPGAGTAEGRRQLTTQTVIDDPASADRALGLLSNTRYARMLTAQGAGWSRHGQTAVTRWRPDPTCDTDGSFVFLRDIRGGQWWSATTAPRPVPGEIARTIFSDHKAEFLKTVGSIETHLEVIVASEADAEGSRLTIRNTGTEMRSIEVTTYGEIVIDAEAADRAHPAFSKMFVETRISEDRSTITARRNPRDRGTPTLCLAHVLAGADNLPGLQAETDRRAFLGRGRGLGRAAAFDPGAQLTGAEGFTMDPCFALRRVLRLPPGKEAVLIFWTIVAGDEAALAEALDHYRNPAAWDHEARLAWTRSQIELRRANSSLDEVAVFREAARHLLFPDLRLNAPEAEGAAGRQSGLWPLGISGDVPIILLRIDTESDLPIARKSLRLMEYLRGKGVRADLVLVNEQVSGYAQDLQNALLLIVDQAMRLAPESMRQAVHVLRRDLVPAEAMQSLLACARIALHARNGTWSDQLARVARSTATAGALPPLLLPPPAPAGSAAPLSFPAEELEFPNGYGGFAEDGRSYVIRLRHGEATPHPWINVIARGDFGFHVPAEGGGYTWAANSRDYPITPWTNDPVENRPGEGLMIRDRRSGRMATPFAALSEDPAAIYECRHAPGLSRFRSWSDWIEIEAEQALGPDLPAKITRLVLRNIGAAPLELDCLAWAELVLGQDRAAAAPMIRVRPNAGMNALLADNPWNSEYTGRRTALGADRPLAAHLAARRHLVETISGRMRWRLAEGWPAGDEAEATLGDPCLAVMVALTLAPGASAEIRFVLADAPAADLPGVMARALAPAGPPASAARWQDVLDSLQVETPDRKFDLMVNTWLPYQCLSCRIEARTAFYQASGAYGFRDQLQDTAAMILQDPGLARRQILAAAGRQFAEGDVQHWWLPATGAGVRTTISDDVVWLAQSTARYVALTGDAAVLDEPVPYLSGPALAEGQHDAFFVPGRADRVAPLFDHCARALDLAMARTGPNGIPLMLGGDWNDGMNRVGIGGRGESVWLGWFLCRTIDDFAPLAEARGEAVRAAAWRAHRDRVARAIDATAWDGDWYRRGTFDDGTPLGTAGAAACRIDSIAQSWAALSGAAPPDRAGRALDAALLHLRDDAAGLMRLFTPPFDGTTLPDPGYIAAYPPGVRENGGQYTHAAAWMVHALARTGRGDEAHALFDLLNPISHSATRAAADRYRVEPYVVAADIYGEGEKTGRGGWTWYTGAAGWLYRAGVEGILGIQPAGGSGITVTPSLPAAWAGYTARLRRNGVTRRITVQREGQDLRVDIDGERQPPA